MLVAKCNSGADGGGASERKVGEEDDVSAAAVQ